MNKSFSIHLALLLGVSAFVSACAEIKEMVVPEPVQLLCKFTGGYAKFADGSSIPSKIQWEYRLVLDKPNNSVYFSTTTGERKELIKAVYAANRVQFPLELIGNEHTVLLNPEELTFEMTKETEYGKSLNKGVCTKQ